MSRRPGVLTAFVHAVDARQGRVQVEYRGVDDDLRSTWAPIASPMSGGGRGHLFMPEVGDECLVAFESGDFDHPFVVGFLWNGEHESSESEASNRVIVTPGGHQLRFEDKQHDTRVVLRSSGEHELVLEDRALSPSAQLSSAGGRELLLDDAPTGGKARLASTQHALTLDDSPAGAKIVIDSGMGAVTLTLSATPLPSLSISVAGNTIEVGSAELKISAAGKVSVEAAGAVDVRAAGAASVLASGAVNVTAGGAATINAATTTVNSGALTVNSGIATFSGAVVASTLIAGTVVASTYTPGVGNLI